MEPLRGQLDTRGQFAPWPEGGSGSSAQICACTGAGRRWRRRGWHGRDEVSQFEVLGSASNTTSVRSPSVRSPWRSRTNTSLTTCFRTNARHNWHGPRLLLRMPFERASEDRLLRLRMPFERASEDRLSGCSCVDAVKPRHCFFQEPKLWRKFGFHPCIASTSKQPGEYKNTQVNNHSKREHSTEAIEASFSPELHLCIFNCCVVDEASRP